MSLQVIEQVDLPVSQLNLDAVFQPRKALSSDALAKYEEAVLDELDAQGKSTCPPVDVLLYEGKYYLIHGHHRYQVFLNLNQEFIPATIYRGTWQEAIQFAMQANIFNGLQLSKKEVAIACRRFLEVSDAMPESERLSDRAIAKKFLVSPKSIRNYRKQNAVAKLATSWEEGKTMLLHKNYKKFDPSLKLFCYATYLGALDLESAEASFAFQYDVCFVTGTYSIYDFELPAEQPEEFVLPAISVGSVVWIDEYYGWGVVYKVVCVDDSDCYQCLSWRRGLCRTYDAIALTEEQAEAISPVAKSFFPPLDFAALIFSCIARLQVLISDLQEEIEQGVGPVVLHQATIKRHEFDIQQLEKLVGSCSDELGEDSDFPVSSEPYQQQSGGLSDQEVEKFIASVVKFFQHHSDRITADQARSVIEAAQQVFFEQINLESVF